MFKQIRQDALPTGTLNQTLTIPWYDPSQTTNPTSAGTMPALELGEKWTDFATGNEFAMVYLDFIADTTYSGGVLVAQALPGTDTIAGTSANLDTVTLVTGGLTVNAEVGNYIFFQDLGVTRLIKANTATTVSVSLKTSLVGNQVFDADVLPGIPVNGSNVVIFRPFHAVICTTTLSPIGVLVNDTVLGNRCVVQISGFGFILGNNSATALAAGIPAGTGATGFVDGISPGDNMSGKYIIPWAAYDNVNILIPCSMQLE